MVIDLDTRKVTYEKSINFDQALPQFKTRNGVLPNRDPLVKHSSPRLWAAALDRLFAQMKKDGVALGKILAVSGSGQQHGSVYLNDKAEAALANLDPKKSLEENLDGVFARKTSPIWMDSSTAKECSEIRKKLGGIKFTASRTGLGHLRALHRPADSQVLPRPSPRPTPRRPTSRWSVRSWPRCSPAKSRPLILATAPA